MLNTILRIFFTAFTTILLANFLPGIHVLSPESAIKVAIVLALLRIFVKPLLILFTLPVTVFTLGLFLLVINAIIILMASNLVDGFIVDGFWYALLFSILLSMFQSAFNQLLENKKR